jgi:hypothetical protein
MVLYVLVVINIVLNVIQSLIQSGLLEISLIKQHTSKNMKHAVIAIMKELLKELDENE